MAAPSCEAGRQAEPDDSAEAGAARRFIRTHLIVSPVAGLDGLKLYTPHAGSRLSRLAAVPYWAFRWAGGLALAEHIGRHPQLVAGRSVLDIGAGAGLVGIAAARAGATHVVALEADPLGRAAIALNAEANGVCVTPDAPAAKLPGADLVLAGDVFYDAQVAARMLPLLAALAGAGAEVLVGDPFRRDLPLHALTQIAEYEVADMGDGPAAAKRRAGIFRLAAG